MHRLLPALILVASPLAACAHDTWVETNTNLVRTGDAVHVSLMLGNHGNDHRDFKLASKVELEGTTLAIVAPDGKKYDIRDQLADVGYAPKEGFWTTKFAATQPGTYIVAHTLDRVVNHGRPIRSIKSGKAIYVHSASLDKVPMDNPGFDRALGHALELVPTAHPVTPMGPGRPLSVKLLHEGKPLGGARVSFIPRGETLSEGFDERYERNTNEAGEASFTPQQGNYYLIVAHVQADDEKGDGYEATQYSATLTVLVPDVCPCCGE
ncbi:MAG: DUF4198 domain-containing protein [Planctomycetaceae bacterium]